MKAIVVVDENWGIGKDGGLLVHLSGDLKYYKSKTYGKTVVIGRKTLESFPGAKPLPGRKNLVLTRNTEYKPDGCQVFNSKEQLMEYLGSDTEEVYVSGGENIYRQFLEDCDRFYVTKIYDSFPADRSFPNLDLRDDIGITWKSDMQEENGIRYQFFEYTRK